MRRAIALSERARANDNHPFGALLVDDSGEVVLEAENTVETDRDVTGHAETNLVRMASAQIGGDLSDYTLYTSCEPCAMCTGAIFWAGIGRIVFALSAEGLMQFFSNRPDAPLHYSTASRLLQPADGIRVEGPALEAEAAAAHEGFWET